MARDRVRVTVLTSRLVRIEYSPDGQFEDRGTLTVVNRRFPSTPFTVTDRAGALDVDTGEMKVSVADTARPFTRSTLSARIGRGRKAVTWAYGDRPRTNLGGTTRTLDNCRGREVRELVDLDPDGNLVFSDWRRWDLDPGLLSLDGWVVVDDSTSPVINPGAGADSTRGRGWPEARRSGVTDIYLLGHGRDHKGALADAAGLLGSQPLPPRWAFGYWYSRYHAYTDREVLAIADQFDAMDVPLDVMVVDMDWHLPGWTGYTWDRRYFPDPTDTVDQLHRRGLRVGLNVHPAEGVGSHEDAYQPMATELGLDPAGTAPIAFDVTDRAFMDAYFTHLHHPEERRGVDFWWMDWQQGTTSAIAGLDPLTWLNELHWSDQEVTHPDWRPLVFSRWGGLGGGRYPLGFSGDAWSTWDSLALQPWFTATAANVAYGYWSHDIGGHYGPPPSPELYTRWVQFGVHSPVLRTHATKHPDQERRFWEFADPYRSVMVDAVRHRYELVPYIYGHSHRTAAGGSCLVRPMYHDHPDHDAAYEATGQYRLGDDLVVAPVVSPLESDQMAPVMVWLPPGRWYDTALGQMLNVRAAAGTWFDRRYLLSEVPVFAAAGAVVPGQLGARRLDGTCYGHLSVTAYPGGDGHGELYEDDGSTLGYRRGESVTVALHQRITERGRDLRISPAKGRYRGWQRYRPVQVRFVAEAPPLEVKVGDRRLPRAMTAAGSGVRAGRSHWYYDAATASVVVNLVRVDLAAGVTVRVGRDPDLGASATRLLDGLPGLARRLDVVSAVVGTVSPPYPLHPDERLAADLAQAANRVGREPSTFAGEITRLRRTLGRLDEVLGELCEAWTTAVALPWPEQRQQSIDALEAARTVLAATRTQFG